MKEQNNIQLTEKEIKMLHAIPNTEYNDGCEISHSTWVFCVAESKEEVGILSSLVKKELALVLEYDNNDNVCNLTEKGIEVYLQLFGNDSEFVDVK